MYAVCGRAVSARIFSYQEVPQLVIESEQPTILTRKRRIPSPTCGPFEVRASDYSSLFHKLVQSFVLKFQEEHRYSWHRVYRKSEQETIRRFRCFSANNQNWDHSILLYALKSKHDDLLLQLETFINLPTKLYSNTPKMQEKNGQMRNNYRKPPFLSNCLY